MKGLLAAAVVVALAVGVMITEASAHIERASYWPSPNPDSSLNPHAGGAVPEYRSLYSALRTSRQSRTRIVCPGRSRIPSLRGVRRANRRLAIQRRRGAGAGTLRSLRRSVRRSKRRYNRRIAGHPSIRRLRGSLSSVRRNGFKLRPSQAVLRMTRRERLRSRRFNERLLKKCRFSSIQRAVNASNNHDRIVVMPGLYTEPDSRRSPNQDPKCRSLRQLNDRGQSEGLSYKYQSTCPNDQNLIYVQGRTVGRGQDPQPPLFERRGIPNEGECIRCNLQIQGSGPTPDDAIIDGGRVESGDGAPIESKKDVTMNVDRADGFVLANMKLRHASEHNIYIHEVDGFLLERFKVYYAAEYGILTFTADHGVIQNCDAAGHGDAAIYPGSAADTGEESTEGNFRYNQELRNCDMRHSALGYSGTAANAVHIHDNRFYDNTTGFSTDVFTAAGHPGFPQDSDLVEDNYFYSNNFNSYAPGSDVEPTVPVPVGLGAWIAGGNNNTFRNNHFWNNWKRGMMVFSVPDAFVCGSNPVAGGNEQAGCDQTKVSTSHRNSIHANVMGRSPSNVRDPNGVDFWWDNFPGNRENCWFGNTGKDGNAASITTTPPLLPNCLNGRNPNTSIGTGSPNPSEPLQCFTIFDEDTPDIGSCDWFETPPEPG